MFLEFVELRTLFPKSYMICRKVHVEFYLLKIGVQYPYRSFFFKRSAYITYQKVNLRLKCTEFEFSAEEIFAVKLSTVEISTVELLRVELS